MFKKLLLRGITLEEFKDLFEVKREAGEKEKDSLLRTAEEKKGVRIEVERDEDTQKLKKKLPENK